MSRQLARNQRASAKNAVTNVRVVDKDANTDGLYIDRVIGQLFTSESQITVLATSSISFIGGASGQGYTVGYNYAITTDEFTAMASQFETYRVRAVRFDVYDLAPTVLGPVAWSTYHDVTVPSPTWSFDQVVDGADSKLIPVGEGKATFYWRAHGTTELGWQSTVATTTTNYGGLRAFFPAGTQGKTFQVVAKWIMDFRGRV